MLEKKYFTIIEKIFIYMAVLCLFQVPLFLVLNWVGIYVHDLVNTPVSAFVFGYNGVLQLTNAFQPPLFILTDIFYQTLGFSGGLLYLFSLAGLLPPILFLLAQLYPKVRKSKYAFRFKVLAVTLFGFNMLVYLFAVIVQKVTALYTVDYGPNTPKISLGWQYNVLLIVKVTLLLAAYFYIKELTHQHLNRKQELDADLSDTVFADIEKTELVLKPTNRLKRFANWLLDSFFAFTMLHQLALMFPTQNVNEWKDLSNYADYKYWIFGGMVIYYIAMEAIFSLTLGKAITGTLVVDENAEPIGIGKATARTIFRLIPFEPLTMFIERALHDGLSKTYVVDADGEPTSLK